MTCDLPALPSIVARDGSNCSRTHPRCRRRWELSSPHARRRHARAPDRRAPSVDRIALGLRRSELAESSAATGHAGRSVAVCVGEHARLARRVRLDAGRCARSHQPRARLHALRRDPRHRRRPRVRMGLHTGTAELRDGDCFGTDVNRAARPMAVAHGGQVVCSQATADLAGCTGVGWCAGGPRSATAPRLAEPGARVPDHAS